MRSKAETGKRKSQQEVTEETEETPEEIIREICEICGEKFDPNEKWGLTTDGTDNTDEKQSGKQESEAKKWRQKNVLRLLQFQ